MNILKKYICAPLCASLCAPLCALCCMLLSACASATYPLYMGTSDAIKEAKAYAIWYKKEDLTLPLLAGLEKIAPPKNTGTAEETSQESIAKLGLVFLQGKRFAECTYTKKQVQCTLDAALESPVFPNTTMQYIADTSARLLAHILTSQNTLPEEWLYIKNPDGAANGSYTFTNIHDKSSLHIKDTTWKK